MPFYADARYNVQPERAIAFGGTASATGTGTAILATPPDSGYAFINRTAVLGLNVLTKTAPAGGFTGAVVELLNGTDTVASVTAAAAGTAASSTTVSHGTFTAGGVTALQVRGTCTSAGVLAGGYDVWIATQELYA